MRESGAHEGTKGVKSFKLQMITFRFEEINMSSVENFDEFYAKLNNIVNLNYNLGEIIKETQDS